MEKNSTENKFTIYTSFKESKFLPDDTAVGLLLFMLFQVVISQAYQTVYTFGITSTYISYVFNFLMDAGFVLAVLLVVKEKKDARFFNELKANRKFGFLDVLICLGISLCCIFGFSAITNCFLQLLYNLGYSSVVSDVMIENFGVYLFYVFFMCILPAVSEETLFRGLIFNGLHKKGTKFAIFFSAFLFMIIHGSPDQTVHQFILGIVLAIAFLITDNIWIPILIHFFNNFIAITYTYIYSLTSSPVQTETSVPVTELYLPAYFLYAIISFIVASFIIYGLFKALSVRAKNRDSGKPVQESVETEVTGTLPPYSVLQSNQDEDIYLDENFVKMKDSLSRDSIDGTKRFTKKGKVIYILLCIWLAVEWLSMMFVGFMMV